MEREAFGTTNSGGKRKIEDEIELAKQKAQAIAARILSDADAKRPRTAVEPSPPSSFSSQPSFPVSYATQTSQYNGVPSSKKIAIPNAKVGVIIGRGGDMIKNLQQRSGARIQITRDADADPTSLTRDVELMGTQEQISRAEELINEVIAETDAANSGSSGNRDVAPLQAGSEQFVMKVPNDRVALVIGKGGETIKNMQGQTGARIQVVPLRLPPGDTSTERNVYISGTKEQIEAAKELVNEVISGNRMKVLSGSNTYMQSAYPPSTGWAPQGQPPTQQPTAYGYTQPGGYAVPPPPPYYGGYPPQQTGWEQQTNPAAAQPQQQNTGYDAYGQQAQATSAPSNVNYNYSQVPPASGYNYGQGYPQQPPTYGQDISGQAPAPDHSKTYANPAYGPPATASQPDGSAAAQPSQPGYGPPAAQSSQPGYGTPPAQTSQSGYGPPPTQTPHPGYGPSGVQTPQPGYGTPSAQTPQPGYGTPSAQTPQPGYGTPSAQTPQSGYGAAPAQTSQPGYGTPPPQTSQAGYGAPPPQTTQPGAPASGYGAYQSYSGAPPVQPAYSPAGYPQMGYGQQQDNQAAYSYYGQGGYQTGYYQGAYPAVPPQGPPQAQGQPTNGVPQSSSYGADGGDPTAGSGGTASVAEESEKPQS